MPLKPGENNISYNIVELIKKWELTGEINGRKIRTRKEALRIARAIALSVANEKD